MKPSQKFEEILEGISGVFFALDTDYRFTYEQGCGRGTGLKREQSCKNVFEVFQMRKMRSSAKSTASPWRRGPFRVRDILPGDGLIACSTFGFIRLRRHSVFFQDTYQHKRQQQQKRMLMEVSHVINVAPHLDDLCLNAGERIAAFMEIPAKFVCIYRMISVLASPSDGAVS